MIEELRAKVIELIRTLREEAKKIDARLLLGIQGFAILLFLFGLYHLTLSQGRMETQHLNESLAERRQLLAGMRARVKELAPLEQRVQLLGSEEGKAELTVPPVPRLIQHLGNMSQKISLKVVQVKLGNDYLIDPAHHIQEIPVTIEILSDYASLQEYLSDLYQLPQLFALKGVKIAQNSVLEPYTITATLDFKLYYISSTVRLPAAVIEQTAPAAGGTPAANPQGGASQQTPQNAPAPATTLPAQTPTPPTTGGGQK